MVQFVKTHDGSWVNLEHVARIDRKEEHRFTFVNSANEELGKSQTGFDPAHLAPVVPASPNEAVFEFYARSTERRPASFEEIITIETPILGWYCSSPRARPLTYRPYFESRS